MVKISVVFTANRGFISRTYKEFLEAVRNSNKQK